MENKNQEKEDKIIFALWVLSMLAFLVVSKAYILLGENRKKKLMRKIKKKGFLDVIPNDIRKSLIEGWMEWVKTYFFGLRREHLIEWRKEILKKYNYACVKCKTEENLHVHHIFNYKDFPERADDYENGIVLCAKCHRIFHSLYGKRKNNQEQLFKFLGVGNSLSEI
jgi:hypothetical protein